VKSLFCFLFLLLLLSFSSPSSIYADTLQSDDFNRADSDTLGGFWLEEIGDSDIAGNKLVSSTSGEIIATYVQDPAADPDADYDVSALVQNRTGVICRYQDEDNWYSGYINLSNDTAGITKKFQGNFSNPGNTYNFDFQANTNYLLKVSCIGSAIKVYINGVERASATDTSITASGFPALRGEELTSRFDDFLVEGTADPTPTPTPTTGVNPTPEGGFTYIELASTSATTAAISDIVYIVWVFGGIILFTLGYYFGIKHFKL
jgi:hypothetical protein